MAHVKGAVAKRVVAIVAALVIVLFAAGAWYVSDYSHAGQTALSVMADEDGDADGVTVQTLSDKAVAFVPDNLKWAAAHLQFNGGFRVMRSSRTRPAATPT